MYSQLSEGVRSLLLKTGYKISQENSQRKTIIPNWSGKVPSPKKCELFVGHIPRNCFEDELFPLFQEVGTIYELRLMMEFSGFNKKFGYVMYTNKRDALRAIAKLNGYQIRKGHHIFVLRSTDHSRLIIEGIPADKSEVDIYEEMSKYTPGIKDVIVYNCPVNNLKNYHFALIDYENHRCASLARKKVIPGFELIDNENRRCASVLKKVPVDVSIFNCRVNMDWAIVESTLKRDDERTKMVKSLLVKNVPQNVSENDLLNLFSCQWSFPVEKVRKINNVAYVHFCTRQDAEIALTTLNGFIFCENSIKVKWAKPPVITLLLCQYPMMNAAIQIKSLSGFDLTPGCNENFDRYLPENSPVKFLSDLCQEHGLGDPTYGLITQTSSNVDELVAELVIPNLPCMCHGLCVCKPFRMTAFFLSPKHAFNCVAVHAMRVIHPYLKSIDKRIKHRTNPIYTSPSTLSILNSRYHRYEQSKPALQIDLPNLAAWDPFQDNQVSSPNEEIWNQLMQSAVTLARVELQSKMNSNPWNRRE